MSNRIHMPGGCNGGCGDCGGGCSVPIIGGSVEPEVLFKPGSIVMFKLTGQTVMVLRAEPESPVYIVRNQEYQTLEVFDFELEKLDDD